MKKPLLYLAVLLTVTACKKDETPPPAVNGNNSGNSWIQNNASLKGFVLDSLTHVPVPGIIIGPMPLFALPVMMYDTSNADGAYHQSIYWSITDMGSSLPGSFTLQMLPDTTYYHTPEIISLSGLQDGDQIQHDMSVIPYSHLSVHVTGGGPGDNLELVDFIPGNTLGTLITLGSNVDTVITRPILSNRTVQIELFVNAASYSVTPYLSGYGTTGTISVSYP